MIGTQRSATTASLQDLTRLEGRADGDPGQLAWSLVLDSLVLHAETELRWLDHCESRVARAAAQRSAVPFAAPAVPAEQQVRR